MCHEEKCVFYLYITFFYWMTQNVQIISNGVYSLSLVLKDYIYKSGFDDLCFYPVFISFPFPSETPHHPDHPFPSTHFNLHRHMLSCSYQTTYSSWITYCISNGGHQSWLKWSNRKTRRFTASGTFLFSEQKLMECVKHRQGVCNSSQI